MPIAALGGDPEQTLTPVTFFKSISGAWRAEPGMQEEEPSAPVLHTLKQAHAEAPPPLLPCAPAAYWPSVSSALAAFPPGTRLPVRSHAARPALRTLNQAATSQVARKVDEPKTATAATALSDSSLSTFDAGSPIAAMTPLAQGRLPRTAPARGHAGPLHGLPSQPSSLPAARQLLPVGWAKPILEHPPVPAAMALDPTEAEIAGSGHLLGISVRCADATRKCGIQVASVASRGPSAGRLYPGDLIVKVRRMPPRSFG
jgi:hypothetical protein